MRERERDGYIRSVSQSASHRGGIELRRGRQWIGTYVVESRRLRVLYNTGEGHCSI